MSEAGRPTELSPELTLEIRKRVIRGEKYVQIQADLGISSGTWDTWVWENYQGFRDELTQWKHEKLVKKSEEVLEDRVASRDEDVSLRAAIYITERLAKEHYSKRVENTGKNGEPLVPQEKVDSTIQELKEKYAEKPTATTGPDTPTGTQEMAGDKSVV